MEELLRGNSLTGGRPHVGGVDVLFAVVIEIGPARAHAGARIVDVGFAGDCGERAVAVVAIEIAAPEIVGHVEIGRSAGVGVAPRAGEAVAVVFGIQPCRFRPVDEGRVAFVVQQKICAGRCARRSRERGSDTGRAPGSSCRGRSRYRGVRRDRSRRWPHA